VIIERYNDQIITNIFLGILGSLRFVSLLVLRSAPSLWDMGARANITTEERETDMNGGNTAIESGTPTSHLPLPSLMKPIYPLGISWSIGSSLIGVGHIPVLHRGYKRLRRVNLDFILSTKV
jgi:hypothetical protein